MKPSKGISVDGGCSGNPGLAYYRAVDIETGKELFRKDIGVATNNIAEFLGLCHALHAYPNDIIYTDSITAIAWVRNKKAKTTFSGAEISNRLINAEEWLCTLKETKITKWDTKKWGEIPADFGLK